MLFLLAEENGIYSILDTKTNKVKEFDSFTLFSCLEEYLVTCYGLSTNMQTRTFIRTTVYLRLFDRKTINSGVVYFNGYTLLKCSSDAEIDAIESSKNYQILSLDSLRTVDDVMLALRYIRNINDASLPAHRYNVDTKDKLIWTLLSIKENCYIRLQSVTGAIVEVDLLEFYTLFFKNNISVKELISITPHNAVFQLQGTKFELDIKTAIKRYINLYHIFETGLNYWVCQKGLNFTSINNRLYFEQPYIDLDGTVSSALNTEYKNVFDIETLDSVYRRGIGFVYHDLRLSYFRGNTLSKLDYTDEELPPLVWLNKIDSFSNGNFICNNGTRKVNVKQHPSFHSAYRDKGLIFSDIENDYQRDDDLYRRRVKLLGGKVAIYRDSSFKDSLLFGFDIKEGANYVESFVGDCGSRASSFERRCLVEVNWGRFCNLKRNTQYEIGVHKNSNCSAIMLGTDSHEESDTDLLRLKVEYLRHKGNSIEGRPEIRNISEFYPLAKELGLITGYGRLLPLYVSRLKQYLVHKDEGVQKLVNCFFAFTLVNCSRLNEVITDWKSTDDIVLVELPLIYCGAQFYRFDNGCAMFRTLLNDVFLELGWVNIFGTVCFKSVNVFLGSYGLDVDKSIYVKKCTTSLKNLRGSWEGSVNGNVEL